MIFIKNIIKILLINFCLTVRFSLSSTEFQRDLFIDNSMIPSNGYKLQSQENSEHTQYLFELELKNVINTLEETRDKAFIDIDYLLIERTTRDISSKLLKNRVLSLHLTEGIHSIIKTRFFYPGKIDLLSDFYAINKFDSLSYTNNISLILLVDTVTYLLAKDVSFYDMFGNIEENHILIKEKIISESKNSVIDSVIRTNTLLENNKISNDISLLIKIYEMSKKFSPIISFNDLYNKVIFESNHCGFEVICINKFHYWPLEMKPEDRQNFQRIISNNYYISRFKPLSLQTIQIDLEAIRYFPELKNYTGSFVPYICNNFDGIKSEMLLLVTKNSSNLKYNHENIKKLEMNYMGNPTPIFVRNKKDLRHYAEQGIVSATYKYALMLFSEKVAAQKDSLDCLTYVGYLKRAAQEGYTKAQYNLGMMYFHGDSVCIDDVQSAKWYELAATNGHFQAQYNLGMMYANGLGVTLDEKNAFKWYYLSAEQKYANAQYNLGVCYFNGFGVDKNMVESAKWYSLAADQGHCDAQYNLGMMYSNGLGGLPRDLIIAEYWRRLSIDDGHQNLPYISETPQNNNKRKREEYL
jgi:hypothetical protein